MEALSPWIKSIIYLGAPLVVIAGLQLILNKYDVVHKGSRSYFGYVLIVTLVCHVAFFLGLFMLAPLINLHLFGVESLVMGVEGITTEFSAGLIFSFVPLLVVASLWKLTFKSFAWRLFHGFLLYCAFFIPTRAALELFSMH